VYTYLPQLRNQSVIGEKVLLRNHVNPVPFQKLPTEQKDFLILFHPEFETIFIKNFLQDFFHGE